MEDSDDKSSFKPGEESSINQLKKQMQVPLVSKCDISPEQSNEVLDTVIGNIDKFGGDLEMAAKHTKESLDKHYGMTWQVIIGKGYSFDVTALECNLLHCYYQGELGILVFKT